MKNKFTDLNNHLFSQLERLSDENLKGEDLKVEIERSKAVAIVADKIIDAAKVTVEAMALVGKGSFEKTDLPLLLADSNVNK
ncbi:MAG: hypothetical protein ABI675_19590 [Chitinophagaceae bacterium]